MKTIHRYFFGLGEIALNGDPAVTLGDRSWKPDETTAYIKFALSFAFPNVSNYGDGIHVGVIARSFTSMDGKPVNSNHKMVAYGAEGDQIIGTVRGVDFPTAPEGGWKTSLDRKGAPNMTGVAALWLNSEGAIDWITRFQTGRKAVAVSMEVLYGTAISGFAVDRTLRSGEPAAGSGKETPRIEGSVTPSEFWDAGWEYVPMSALLTPDQMKLEAKDIAALAAKAPKDSLLRTRDFKAKRMNGGSLMGSGLVGIWKGRDVYFLQGGIDGVVHYPGMGLVERGAEPKAGIETMLAADEELTAVESSLQEITQAVKIANGEL